MKFSSIRIDDDCIECDEVFGPLPNIFDSFEEYFQSKSGELLKAYEENNMEINEDDCEIVAINTMKMLKSFNWMLNVALARNSQQQNIEIINNNKQVYFKAKKHIKRHEILYAFPSKDLEISLGLQFIPYNKDANYKCRKCSQILNEQYCLMLHSKYFCSSSASKRKISNDEYTTANKIMKTSENDSHIKTTKPEVPHQINEQMSMYNKYIQTMASQLLAKNMPNYSAYPNFASLLSMIPFNTMVNQFHPNPQLILQQQKFLAQFGQAAAAANFNEINSNVRIPIANVRPALNLPTAPKIPQKLLPNISATPKSPEEIFSALNSQSVQNWCAKCNTHFRLTSDLVYHMRTYHKKEEANNSVSQLINQGSINPNKLQRENREQKYLKCEICYETFKEKHHLTRHMTSHRWLKKSQSKGQKEQKRNSNEKSITKFVAVDQNGDLIEDISEEQIYSQKPFLEMDLKLNDDSESVRILNCKFNEMVLHREENYDTKKA